MMHLAHQKAYLAAWTTATPCPTSNKGSQRIRQCRTTTCPLIQVCLCILFHVEAKRGCCYCVPGSVEEFRPQGAAEQPVYSGAERRVWERCRVTAHFAPKADVAAALERAAAWTGRSEPLRYQAPPRYDILLCGTIDARLSSDTVHHISSISAASCLACCVVSSEEK